MKIISLSVENFLRVEAAEIRPDGNMVVIAGPNESGKSSIINGMWVALGGDAPEMPIRDGADKARLVVEVGDDEIAPILVERVYTASGMRLKVSQEHDGARIKYDRPQALLTAMLSGIAFDPEAFSRMPAKKQAELLSSLTGLDTSDLDVEFERVFAERRDINRDIKAMGECPAPEGERPEPTDVAWLAGQLKAAQTEKDEFGRWFLRRDRAAGEVDPAERRVDAAQKELNLAKNARDAARQLRDELCQKMEKLPDPSDRISELDHQLASAESRNAAVREYDMAEGRAEAKVNRQMESDWHTTELDNIKAKRATRIAECKMPIEGLAIEDGAVKFEGVPYSQASSARKLEIGFAIGRAQNPKLKVVRIENGSLLDARMMAVVERECDEHGYQAWIERVADSDDGVGIYIEDGVVAERESGAETPDMFGEEA